MKRTIILKAEDEGKKIHLVCKIDKSVFKDLNKDDEMYQFTENLADKFNDALRESFFQSAIKSVKP